MTDVTVLAGYTTLGLGGPAKALVAVGTEAELIDAVRAADAAGEPVLLIGGGSNLVIADDGFPGTVIAIGSRGVSSADRDGRVAVTVAAGEDWDDVVATTVAEGLAGLECLSGIPGRAGATPIQNVGAYGQEVAEAITTVRVFDRLTGQIRIIPNEECRFSYRNSMFKAGRTVPEAMLPAAAGSMPAPRYVVLDVTFLLAREPLSMPVKYAELASDLGVRMGERAAAGEVRSAVLKIRGRKGMLLNPGDPDSRSAGSFFTNPVLSAEQLAVVEAAARDRGAGTVPRFEAGASRVKVPAAWLIERSGFGKGYGEPGRARVSSKHTLALVNVGGATTADLLSLAREIRDGVRTAFGVTLAPEPILVGVTL